MDEKLLASLGLNVKEVKIFKAVLKNHELSPARLSKTVGVKRTTCYSLARGLVEKGFLVEHTIKRPRTFAVADSTHIEEVLLEERKRLADREKLVKRFTAELSRATVEDNYPVPQIRFIEEDKLERFQLSEISRWQESVMRRDKTWWGFQDHTWVEKFGHLIPKYWKSVPSEVSLKFLSNQEDVRSEIRLKPRYPRRSIKYWSKATQFVSSLWVIGDYVVILNTRCKPFYAVEIHDETLAHDLREVFKNLWPLI